MRVPVDGLTQFGTQSRLNLVRALRPMSQHVTPNMPTTFSRHSNRCIWWRWVALALILTGCETTNRSLAFVGGYVPPERSAQPDALSTTPAADGASRSAAAAPTEARLSLIAHGWIVSTLNGESLSLEITNRGTRPIRLSYAADHYLGRTRDGRTVDLEKSDFLHYPDLLNPRETGTVTLVPPANVEASELLHLIANLNLGQIVLVLNAVDQTRPLDEQMGGTQLLGQTAESAAGSGALIQEPSHQATFPSLPAADASVPVEVEFQQEFGTLLTVEVGWNDQPEAVTLATGGQRTFYVAPGQHGFRVRSVLASIAKTEGEIPVLVVPGEPMRITIDARATMNGAVLRVRLWSPKGLVADHHLSPATPS